MGVEHAHRWQSGSWGQQRAVRWEWLPLGVRVGRCAVGLTDKEDQAVVSFEEQWEALEDFKQRRDDPCMVYEYFYIPVHLKFYCSDCPLQVLMARVIPLIEEKNSPI